MIKPKYQVVEDRPELIRDTYSKGITNRDTSAYEKYMESASREINILKEQMSEMQDVLQQILNKVNGN